MGALIIVFAPSDVGVIRKAEEVAEKIEAEYGVFLTRQTAPTYAWRVPVKIGMYSKLLSTSHLATFGKGLKMGNNSAIGDYTHFGAPGGIEIGNDVIMGSYISFHSENHNFSDTTRLIREQGVTSKGIKLGNNIWVGAKVTFLDGCVVGDNSVVAAGAVVNGIYPDNSVIGGVPARVIKTIE